MPRLFWKLFFSLWLSIMGFAVVMAVVNNILVQQADVPQEPEDRLNRDVELLEKRLSQALQQQGPQAAQKIIRALPRQVRNRVYLFDENGRELAGRDIARERIRSRQIQSTNRRLTDAENNVYRLVVLRRPPPGALLEPGKKGIAWRLLVASITSALVSFIIARYLAAPLVHLGAASRRLAGGDLSTRVGAPLTGRRDEFGVLANDFDQMALRLQDLQKANRRLLRDVSHELRSPLARLRVALEIARNRDSSEVESELSRIELESERLETLVDEVLGLLRESSEANPIKKERFDFVELLTDLEEVVRYEIPDHQPGLKIIANGPMPVEADRELMWRAFENLIRNALIHTDDNAGVEIEAIFSKDKSGIDVFVRDSGPGVPPKHLSQIFKPFYRVQESRDRNSGGHGLGLAIAQAAIKRHGGNIRANNRDTGGLEVHVEIPV
jgi:two-component system sensor histidine kinase CpxA